ncbi:MAG: hypothetical protein HDKAJFGB_01343 [Anaerolineae bacterium]|nr:hypothetical protein [Anaerolineae bacterium]
MRRIELLGGLRVTENAQALNVSGARAVSLLAYLALYPHTRHTREFLAELLSPDAPPERVRRNFSDALYRLRQTLGAAWVEADAERVWLADDVALTTDVWEFEQLAAHRDPASLESAVAFYKGDLLPEVYDDWILLPRSTLQEKYLAALESLSEILESQNDVPRALAYARQLIAADPLRETSHQTYLRLLGRSKRRAQAVVHFDYVRQLFRTELGVELLPETRALGEAIRSEAETISDAAPATEQLRFVGRAHEREIAIDGVERAMRGQGAVLCVEGEAGMGKSRLLREIAASAQWRGMATAYGVASENSGGSPFLIFGDALVPLLQRGRASQLETILSNETLAGLGALYAPWQNRASLPELPPAQARMRFQNDFVTLLKTLAQLSPLVLMLDDLQWADAAVWDLLDALLPRLAQTPLLLLLAYRRPGIEKNAGWEFLQKWERGGLETLALNPLTAADVVQLFDQTDTDEAARVAAFTGGSPFYLSEYLAGQREGRVLERDPIAARLRGLSESARTALNAAAVLGEQVAFRLWTQVALVSPLALAASGEELSARSFLQPTQAGYVFLHDLVRERVYQEIEPAARIALHARAADALAVFDAENWRARAFQLERAERGAEAADAYAQAGAQDLKQFAFRDAEAAFVRALALMPDTESVARVETELALAQTLDALGNRARQTEVLAHARRDARVLQNETQLLKALVMSGRVISLLGQVDEAAAMYDEALLLARKLGDATQEFEVLFWRGDFAMRRGELAAARIFYEQALMLARRVDNRQGEARALRGMGNLTRQEGNAAQALELHLEAIRIHRAMQDVYQEVVTLTNVLGALYDLGMWDRLLTTARDTIGLCESLAYAPGLAVARQLLSLGAYSVGDYEMARDLLVQVVAANTSAGDRRNVGLTVNVLGLVEYDTGNLERARELFLQALEIATGTQAATERGYVLHDMGVLYLATREFDAARDALLAAREIWHAQQNLFLQRKAEAYLGLAYAALDERARALELAQSGMADLRGGTLHGEQAQAWHWALYQLLTQLVRTSDAQSALDAAYAEVLRQASAIADDAMRANFLERVPLNRAIVTAHAEKIAVAETRVVVSLARRDAPLGRALHDSERVQVTWTLDAPEDAAIRGKTAQRQHRLRRLLAEADAQNAAPTDEDLARALGVSRHTILRDMAALAESGGTSPTRRRKRRAE